MPSYSNSAFKPMPVLLTAGMPEYLFGSFSYDKAPTKMIVTNSALTTNVATLTVTVIEGDIPAVGDFVTVVGTSNGAGALNVTHVALTAVTITASTGQGTISFALTHANITSAADSGLAKTLPAETSEAIANGSSVSVVLPFNNPNTNGARTVVLALNTPANTLTGTVVFNLQESLRDEDSEFANIGTSISVPTTATVTTKEYTLTAGRFYRGNVSGITGGAGTIIAKIMA